MDIHCKKTTFIAACFSLSIEIIFVFNDSNDMYCDSLNDFICIFIHRIERLSTQVRQQISE